MQVILPAQIGMPSFHKDGSAVLKFETRELTATEIFNIVALRNLECWVGFSTNKEDISFPDEPAQVEGKSRSQRLRNTIFVWYKQECDAGRFVGLFETFLNEKMEKIIEGVKSKLEK